MANLKDVATEAGVSTATASHALRGSKPVSPGVADRVRDAAARVGYVPHRHARTLRTGRSHTLGVVLPDLTNPFFPALLQAVEASARDAGYGLLVTDSRNDEATEREALQRLASYRIDGLVWVPASARGVAPDVPTVTVDRPATGCDLVHADHGAAGRAVAAHLRQAGRRRVALLAGPHDLPSACARRDGFLGAYRDDDHTVAWRAQVPFGYRLPDEVAARLRDHEGAFDAVVCANDAVAVGVLRALRGAGLAVPEAVAVVGVDDIPVAELVEPALTTVRQPVPRLGREAVALLLERIDRPTLPPRRRSLAVQLVLRASSTAPERGVEA